MNTKVVQIMESNLKIKNCIQNLPKTPGVYIYRNKSGKVIYVGKAVNLKIRVSSYFHPSTALGTGNKDLDPKTKELVKNIVKIDIVEVGSEFEALVLEAELIKRYKPKYNIDWKDDKNYAYIKLSGEKYSRVSVVHQITDPTTLKLRRTNHLVESRTEYMGPFVDVKAMRTILKLARRVFPYCTCGLGSNEICLYFHLGLCKGHGAKYFSEREYARNLKGLISLFSGKTEKLRKELTRDMKKAAGSQKFEKAAELRDKIHYLKRIEQTHLFSDRDLSDDSGLSELAQHLELSKIPQKIESFDISNILGTAATGSMVVFRNGVASPKDYRRFQIKTVKGANDVAMMAEVLARRFAKIVIASTESRFSTSSTRQSNNLSSRPKRRDLLSDFSTRRLGRNDIKGEGRNDKRDKAFSDLPDLVILDGGKGQLSAVLKKLSTFDTSRSRPGLELTGVKIVALAKKREEIVMINDKMQMSNAKSMSQNKKPKNDHLKLKNLDLIGNLKFEIVNLPRESEALYLVQRIRDEAHRFAVSYHRKLKSKEVFETSLDGIIGVGPKTKKKLIAKYGSVNKIKETSLDDLSKVVGEKIAKRIKEQL